MSKVSSKKASSRKPAARKAPARRRTADILQEISDWLQTIEDKDLKPAYDLATSLILRGHAAAKFSGRTLKQWNATLRSPSAGIGERRVAKAAILGLAAQIVREWLDVDLTIRFE